MSEQKTERDGGASRGAQMGDNAKPGAEEKNAERKGERGGSHDKNG